MENDQKRAYDTAGRYSTPKLLRNIFGNRQYASLCFSCIGKPDQPSQINTDSRKHFVVFDGLGSNRSSESMMENFQQRGSIHKAPTRKRLPLLRNTADPETTAKATVDEITRVINRTIIDTDGGQGLEIAFVAHSLGAAVARKVILLLEEKSKVDKINYLEPIKEIHTYAGACGGMELQSGSVNSAVAKLAIGDATVEQLKTQTVASENEKLRTICEKNGIRVITHISQQDTVIAPEHQTYGEWTESAKSETGHFEILETSSEEFDTVLE